MDAGRIAYEVAGEGPLVVGVHGMGDLRSAYRHTVPALVAAGFRVATFDLRGHGDSDATFSAYDDEAAAGDLLALIDLLGGGPALVLGNSMGAAAAVIAAARAPERISGLALLGPFVRDPESGRLKELAMRAALLEPWGPAAWKAYYGSCFPGRKPADFDAHWAAVRASLSRPGRWSAFRRTTRTSHAPAEAALGEVRAPALVVMGTADPDWPDATAEARWVADALSAELLLVDSAGHYPMAEEPEQVNPALVAFARKAFAGAAGEHGSANGPGGERGGANGAAGERRGGGAAGGPRGAAGGGAAGGDTLAEAA
ncbi:alpha/beta fold hydrolase [Conexibacter arvalis]|uniref:alpha/beta fold hydrolase n=1 Tax=Conexibacter arvalis TaxID=912552 RepID=UPI001C844C02